MKCDLLLSTSALKQKEHQAQCLGLFDHLNLDETTDTNNNDILIWNGE